MKGPHQTLLIATAVVALPLFANSQTTMAGQHEATQMKPARAILVRTLDADKDHDGSSVQARLDQKVTLDNGVKLPRGTMLLGKVTNDDMQEPGKVKLALRFDQARLKDGNMVPVRATIVGLYSPDSVGNGSLPDQQTGDQVPDDWTAKTLQMDQENVVSGVDLHSRISSHDSGVFVSTRKDDIKLRAGSEIQFALGPAANGQNTPSTGGL